MQDLSTSLHFGSSLAWCELPAELDNGGSATFLEDCPSLSRFTIPIPPRLEQRYGIHPMICCPRELGSSPICFPTDAWCITYPKPKEVPTPPSPHKVLDQAPFAAQATVVVLDENVDYDKTKLLDPRVVNSGENLNSASEETQDQVYESEPLYSDRDCGTTNTTVCTPVSRCGLLDERGPDELYNCGFDDKSVELMICCPYQTVLGQTRDLPKPRFTKGGEAYKCEDKNKLCNLWNINGACKLDQHFTTSFTEPEYVRVMSSDMFELMTVTCTESCGRCGKKGCIDEHPSCVEWARLGKCMTRPAFMAHTCRESCGVCGFLSIYNTEAQRDEGKSYTNLADKDFHCGRFKNLIELEKAGWEVIGGLSSIATTSAPTSTTLSLADSAPNITLNEPLGAADVDIRLSEKTDDKEDKEISSVQFLDDINDSLFENTITKFGNISCTSVPISDRWLITAAHCTDEFQISEEGQKIKHNSIRTNLPQFREYIEAKNIYRHPGYELPLLYNDIALIELGRRIQFIQHPVGDSPICLDPGLKLEGRVVSITGYGYDEKQIAGNLLTANTTLIGLNECNTKIEAAVKERGTAVRRNFCRSMEYGATDDHICAQGFLTDKRNSDGERVVTAACKGDSGGPITLDDEQGRRTLIGVVSGSIWCNSVAPEWYTRYDTYREWVQCIVKSASTYKFSKVKVEKACKSTVRYPERKKIPMCDI